MNFLQIAALVVEELDDYPLPLATVNLSSADLMPVQRKAIRAVQRSFDLIMEFSRHWKFLNKRGVIFELVAGQREYQLPLIESIEWDSCYLTRAGSTTRWPLFHEEYDDWQQRERVVVPTTSVPVNLIWGPSSDRWIVWPTPAEAWTVNGNWQQRKSRLVNATDEPPWDAKYHELLVWAAVMQAEGRERVQEDVTTAIAASTAQRAYAGLWSAFLGEYLPKPRGAEAL